MNAARPPYDRPRLAALFDQLARHSPPESGVEGGIMARLVERSLALLELDADDVLLDAGTGTGTIALQAARRCRQVYGIDISRAALAQACERADRLGLTNVSFARSAIEEPELELQLDGKGINKLLLLRSLHHLPDKLKRSSLKRLSSLLKRPGRMVIGDLMFFEPPDRHRNCWDEVGYDGGLTDHPATAVFLARCLEELGAVAAVERLHPLVGAVTGDFN